MNSDDLNRVPLKLVTGDGIRLNYADEPQECVFIHRIDEPELILCDEGTLFVWTTTGKAKQYIEKNKLHDAGVSKVYTWEELVKYSRGKCIAEVLIDHTGDEGFYSIVPIG